MRRLGAMPYMTPLQRATESSSMPKSVMKTTVGGGSTAGGCAGRGLATRSSRTNQKQSLRVDFAAEVNVIHIKPNSPKRLLWSAGVPARPGRARRPSLLRRSHQRVPVYCAIVPLPASIIEDGNKSIQERASDVQRDS